MIPNGPSFSIRTRSALNGVRPDRFLPQPPLEQLRPDCVATGDALTATYCGT